MLYRKLEKNIPRKETARSQSQFLHSYTLSVSDLYIPTIGLPIWLQKKIDRSWEYVKRSQMYEYGNWEQGRAV